MSLWALVLFAFVPLFANCQELSINNLPNPVIACLPVQLSWSGGTPPYFPSVVPAGQPDAAALVTFQQQDSLTLTWDVNLPAGSSVELDLKDSTGESVQSAPSTIQANPDMTC
ncbi:hypothetical protein BGZ49_009045 [Haplosporangium sp. Z 27]|nr:hypothetical protein BGZ49_009045 [Haplosporangium sp. Z 27]